MRRRRSSRSAGSWSGPDRPACGLSSPRTPMRRGTRSGSCGANTPGGAAGGGRSARSSPPRRGRPGSRSPATTPFTPPPSTTSCGSGGWGPLSSAGPSPTSASTTRPPRRRCAGTGSLSPSTASRRLSRSTCTARCARPPFSSPACSAKGTGSGSAQSGAEPGGDLLLAGLPIDPKGGDLAGRRPWRGDRGKPPAEGRCGVGGRQVVLANGPDRGRHKARLGAAAERLDGGQARGRGGALRQAEGEDAKAGAKERCKATLQRLARADGHHHPPPPKAGGKLQPGGAAEKVEPLPGNGRRKGAQGGQFLRGRRGEPAVPPADRRQPPRCQNGLCLDAKGRQPLKRGGACHRGGNGGAAGAKGNGRPPAGKGGEAGGKAVVDHRAAAAGKAWRSAQDGKAGGKLRLGPGKGGSQGRLRDG